jgi:hypothetical protein
MPSPQLVSVTHSFGGAHQEQPLRAAGLNPSRQSVAAPHVVQIPCMHQLPLVQSSSVPHGSPAGKRIIG